MSRVVALFVLAGTWSLSNLARAHDPPEISQVTWTSSGLILSTNRGLIIGSADSQDWRLMCNAAWGTPFGEQPDLLQLANGALLAATTRGLQTSSDGGCSWRGVDPFSAAAASALARHPSAPAHLYLAIWDAARGGLYESLDEGATWSMLLHIGKSDHVAQIRIAPSQPDQLYLSGLVHDARTDHFSFQLTHSRDAGRSWTRSYIPLQWNEREALLLAISPLDPNTLLVLAKAGDEGADRLLVSHDAGETYLTLLQASNLRSAGFSVDGRSAFAAGDDGFYRSTADLSYAEPIGEAQFVSYVAAHDGALYLGGNYSRFDPPTAGLGVSRDDGASFAPIMAFTQVHEPMACPADSPTATACKALWTDWQIEVLVGVGGAPIDSVPDWRSFDSAEPEPDTGRPTLSDPRTAPLRPAQPSAAARSAGSCALQNGSVATRADWLGYACCAALWRARRRRRIARLNSSESDSQERCRPS